MQTMTSQALSWIFGRRSIRVYAPGEIDDAVVRQLLEAAMAAPSAAAQDPWRFVVVRNQATLRQLAEALPYGRMLSSAALGIVVCGDQKAAHDQQLSYLLQDCSAAVENLLLGAHALGLGACWLGVHPREKRMEAVAALLGLPSTILPVCCIALGRPGEQKESRTRFNPDFVHHDRW
jgi:nitroreductase